MPPSFGFESSGPSTDPTRGKRDAASRGLIPGLRGEEEERAEERGRSPEQGSGRIAGRLPGQEPQAGLNASLHEVYGNSVVQAALAGIDDGPAQVMQGAMTLGAAGVLIADSAAGLFSNSMVASWLGQYGPGGAGAVGAGSVGVGGSAIAGEAVARHADAPGGGAWDNRSISKVETATRRGGSPISAELQGKLGNAFGGVDFSGVRLHTDGAAVQASAAINARAFTVGTDVYFNQGQFNPGSKEGLHLIAHELTHVVQHLEGRLRPQGDRGEGMNVSRPTDATEVEAEARAADVVSTIGQSGPELGWDDGSIGLAVSPELGFDSGAAFDAGSSIGSSGPGQGAPGASNTSHSSSVGSELLLRDKSDDTPVTGSNQGGATKSNVQISALVFQDDQRPSSAQTALSAAPPMQSEDGSTDVFVWGTFTVTGPKDESLSECRLDIVQDGKVVAKGTLHDARRKAIIGKKFSEGKKNTLSEKKETFSGNPKVTKEGPADTIPLFRIAPAELSKIDTKKDGKVTLRVVVTTTTSTEEISLDYPTPVVLLTRYASDDTHPRYSGSDPEEGGDHWTRPSVAKALEHFQQKMSDLKVGDLSNMNAGDTPDHSTHEAGLSADLKWWEGGDLPTASAEEAVTRVFRDFLADETYGGSIVNLGMTQTPSVVKAMAKVLKAHPEWKPLKDKIRDWENHKHHIHIDFSETTAPKVPTPTTETRATAPTAGEATTGTTARARGTGTGAAARGGSSAAPQVPANLRSEVTRPVTLGATEEGGTTGQRPGSAPARHRNASGVIGRFAHPSMPKPSSMGRNLPGALARPMGQALGGSAAQVKVHTGPDAAKFAQAHSANAVTEGQDIFFGRGQFNPGSATGVGLLAEEVHHAVKGGGPGGISQPGDAHERQAQGFAGQAVGAMTGIPGVAGAMQQGAGFAGQVGGMAGQVGGMAGQVAGMGGPIGALGAQVQGAAGQVQGAAGQVQGALNNPGQAVSRLGGSEAAPAIADRMSQRFGSSAGGDASGGNTESSAAGGGASATGASTDSGASTAGPATTTTAAPTTTSSSGSAGGSGGGGGSTSTSSSSTSSGGSIGGAGGMGAGSAPAPAPTPVAAGQTAAESFKNFASAGATQQAASWPMLGGNVDAGFQVEGAALNEALPTFTATMSGQMAPAPSGNGEVAPEQAQITEQVQGQTPVPAPVVPTAPGRFTGNATVGQNLATLPAAATGAQKEQAGATAIRQIRTTDGSISTTPNPKPAIKLQGEQDPQRTERQRTEGLSQAQTAQQEAAAAVRSGPGPEQVTLKELSEATEVPAIDLGAIPGTEQLPEFEEYLALNLPADVQGKFDEAMAPGMDGAMSQAQSQFDAAATERDTAHEAEISRAQSEVDRSNQEAQKQQETAVRSARSDISAEQQRTIQAQQSEIGKLDTDARRRQSSDIGSIQSRVTQDGAKIDSEFQKAEQKAGQEVCKAEQKAADQKKAAEEKSKNKSWWEKAVDFVADAIKAVAEAVTAVFDAVRSLVASILDAAKAFANRIIDAAASFVKSVITAFGDYLKGLVNNLLGSVFPGLAKALCGYIDQAVELACEMVDHFADKLKKTIADLCDAINGALKFISDTFQEAVNAALEIAKALATGNWQELLWMALEAALKLCGIDPGEFRSVMAQGEETISIIVKEPGKFVGNLIDAAALGFNNFKDHFVDHLKSGFVNWLTGQAGDAGITMPTTFDAGGIASLVMQVTGIDKEYVLEKAKKHIGAENVEKMQQVVGFVDQMWSGGLQGLANNLTEHLDGIYDEVVSKIQNFLMEKIVIAAVTKIATMFNPVGAIVQAVLTAWRLYEFMRDQISRIYGVVKSIIGSVHAIATGAIGGAAAQVEGALAGMIPIAIDLLAKLIGVSGIGKKVREVLQALHKRIDDGIEKLIAKAKDFFKPKETKAKTGTQQGTQVQAGTNTATAGGAQTQQGTAPGTAQQSNANQGQATGGNGVDTGASGGNSQQGRGTTATPGSVTLVTPRLTVRDKDYGAIGLTMHGAARLKSSNDQPLDAGRQSTAQSRLTTALGSAAAARTAAVGVVGLAAQFGAMATEIKRGTAGDLRGNNISVESVSVTSVELPATVQQAIDQATAGQVTGASTAAADQTELTAALEQKQGFSAGSESHSMWVATGGGSLTIMVASTPTPADQLLADWTGRLNTIADTTVRSETAAAIRAAKSGIGALGRLLNNLWAMPDKHGARDKVKSLVWTKEAEVSANIAKGFTAFGETARPVDLNPRETLSSEFYATFRGRFIRISNSIGMGDPGGDAERIWLQTVSTILRTNAAYKAAPAVDPAGRYKDLGSDAMKAIIADFDPICDALAKYMAKQAEGASTFAFWSGKPGCAMAKANAQVALESSALGAMFDGLNIDGAWNIQLWGALSQAYAGHAANKVSGRRYLGFVGKDSSREQSIFNKIEQPAFAGFFKEKVLPVPDITFYACALKVTNYDEADHRFTGGGIKGTYNTGNRETMVDEAEKKNSERIDEYTAQKAAGGTP